MLLGGLAKPLPEPVHMDKHGRVVEKDNPSAYGLPVMQELTDPDWVLFMDKMESILIKKMMTTIG